MESKNKESEPQKPDDEADEPLTFRFWMKLILWAGTQLALCVFFFFANIRVLATIHVFALKRGWGWVPPQDIMDSDPAAGILVIIVLGLLYLEMKFTNKAIDRLMPDKSEPDVSE